MVEPLTLPLVDRRPFGLYDYRHGHNYVLIRGFPDEDWDDDEDDASPEDGAPGFGGTGRRMDVLDIAFLRIERVACRRSFSDLHLRYASASEMTLLEARLGKWQPTSKVYLLEPDTLESYVIAPVVLVATFAIAGGAPSPLVADDPEYVAGHPPIGGVWTL